MTQHEIKLTNRLIELNDVQMLSINEMYVNGTIDLATASAYLAPLQDRENELKHLKIEGQDRA